MNAELAGKNVVVTGASSAIGQEIARALAKEGARLVLHYHRNGTALDSLREELGADVALVGADLTTERGARAVFDAAVARGPVEGWVHAVGLRPQGAQSAAELDLDRWKEILDGNLTAAFLCLREWLRAFSRAEPVAPGAVLVGSTAGTVGEAGFLDYASAKGALVSGFLATAKNELTRVHRLARINAVVPGWTLTPRNEAVARDEEKRVRVLQTVPLRKLATPTDVAAAVLFLCSPLSGHLTGQVLTVAGGMEGRVLFTPSEV